MGNMSSTLKKYFPMIRNREEILKDVNNSLILSEEYNRWDDLRQKEFLDMCSGARGG